MKILSFVLLSAIFALGSENVNIYSSKNLQALSNKLLQKRTRSASQDLDRFGNHYTMLAVRTGTGSSEMHEHEADIFVIESGEATLVTGGKIVNPRTERSGEIRGTSIEGGERHRVAAGDIVHIAAKTPHQLVIENGNPFTYFVVKVTGQ